MLQLLSLNVCDCVSVFVLKIYQSCDVLKKERNGRRQGRERVIVKRVFLTVSQSFVASEIHMFNSSTDGSLKL